MMIEEGDTEPVADRSQKPTLTPEERRLKKQLRRAKQREANVGRAQKMHELRLARSAEVSLAEMSPAESRVAAQQPMPDNAKSAPHEQALLSSVTRYHIGCSGWFYWQLRETFYKSLPTKEWFPEYTRHFKTVEINASFYSWPTEANVRSWLQQVGRKQFIYTVKVSELITHIKQFQDTTELIKDFGYIADMLGSRMGCFLFQLPPGFQYTPKRLTMILQQLDPRHRNVVEFRHASWWNEEVYAAFREAGVIFCSCSAPGLPDELVKTAEDVYIRFHGVDRWYRHDYSKQELQEWTQRILACGARRAWVYFNNTFDGDAFKNARQMIRLAKSP